MTGKSPRHYYEETNCGWEVYRVGHTRIITFFNLEEHAALQVLILDDYMDAWDDNSIDGFSSCSIRARRRLFAMIKIIMKERGLPV